MDRPPLEVADVIRAAGPAFLDRARMCFDRLYAYERIALAHASSDPALRQLALQLFHACHYGGSAQGTVS